MYTFDRYIGQQVRRIVFALRIDGKFYHLLSIWEHLEPDMNDQSAFSSNRDNIFMDRVNEADSKKKVYVIVEDVTLTQEMCSTPWNTIKDEQEEIYPTSQKYAYNILFHAGADVFSLSDNNSHRIVNILPQRSCTAYVSYYLPQEPDPQLQEWLQEKKIQEQLSTLSKRNFGYDLCLYPEFVGQYIFVSYNPIYRAIHWKESEKGLGIYCRIHFRNGERKPLKIDVDGYDVGDRKVFGDSIETENFENFISFQDHKDKSFKYLKVYVYDKDDVLIDYYPRMVFIHQINIDLAIHERTMRVLGKDKKLVREVEKYRSENIQIGQSIPDSLLEDNDFAYQQLEDALDFVYLEGDKNGTNINREKGIKLIQRIINSAKNICYICDVYFNPTDFEEFVWGASSLNVDIRILTSKLGLCSDESKAEMSMRVYEYIEKVKGKVDCRLLNGEPILHDRLIIADDQVWMLGSSLNHFGAKATTLIRVPKAYRKRLIEKVTYWWNNDSESTKLTK